MKSIYLNSRRKKAKTVVWTIASKGLFVSLAIILQIAFYFAFFLYLDNQYYFLSYIASALGAIAVLVLTNKEIHPSIKQGWMFLILLFPLSGSILYFFLGKSRGSTILRKRISHYFTVYEDENGSQDIIDTLENNNVPYISLVKYLKSQHFPIYMNTELTYFESGRLFFESILQDIEKAKERIFIEFFIVDQGELLDMLIDLLEVKVKEGLEVFFIYDGFGGGINLPRNMPSILNEKGIKTSVYNPVFPIFSGVQNNRDHRKIVVIDNRIAYTGGANIADEYINYINRFGYWKDSGIRIEGEAAKGFSHMFLQMWNAVSMNKSSYLDIENQVIDLKIDNQYVIPFSDSPMDNEALSQNILQDMISLAKKRIYITTPYLIPPFEIKELLSKAVKSGIDVRVMLPAIPDKKLIYWVSMAYARLFVESGIKVYTYTPGFVHAKNLIVDDNLAVVGTVNIDFRSLYHHFECGAILLECDEIKRMEEDFLKMVDCSKELTTNDLKKIGIIKKGIEVIMKLFLPLL